MIVICYRDYDHGHGYDYDQDHGPGSESGCDLGHDKIIVMTLQCLFTTREIKEDLRSKKICTNYIVNLYYFNKEAILLDVLL